VLDLLRQNGLDDVIVIGGGIIPPEDIPALKEMGVRAIFGPGTPLEDVVQFIQQEVTGHATRDPSTSVRSREYGGG
jgi:methylmalonyl-CoA mutase C-terminal domain/subunit